MVAAPAVLAPAGLTSPVTSPTSTPSPKAVTSEESSSYTPDIVHIVLGVVGALVFTGVLLACLGVALLNRRSGPTVLSHQGLSNPDPKP